MTRADFSMRYWIVTIVGVGITVVSLAALVFAVWMLIGAIIGLGQPSCASLHGEKIGLLQKNDAHVVTTVNGQVTSDVTRIGQLSQADNERVNQLQAQLNTMDCPAWLS